MEIRFKGFPVTLLGKPLQPGNAMPNFTVMDTSLREVRGSSLSGTRVFLSVPSLDTGVCDQEVRRFNKEAESMPGVSVYAVSMDLPFAQARWCGGAGVSQVFTLSDYKDRSFGTATGTLIRELGLLTRAVFVVDSSGTVAYAEYVPEISEHPRYEEALRALKSMEVS